jgi:hypothetical protein
LRHDGFKSKQEQLNNKTEYLLSNAIKNDFKIPAAVFQIDILATQSLHRLQITDLQPDNPTAKLNLDSPREE